MISELEVLKMITKRLETEGIPYMLTGSIAANFYTIPRMTRDIDLVIDVSESDVEKLVHCFGDEFYVSKVAVERAIQNRKMFNIIHNEALVKVDFIIKKNSEYRKLEFERKKIINFEGENIFITSPEDLIISKLFWARDSMSEIQIKDIKNLMISVLDLDYDYIAKWVKSLKIENIYRKAKDE